MFDRPPPASLRSATSGAGAGEELEKWEGGR